MLGFEPEFDSGLLVPELLFPVFGLLLLNPDPELEPVPDVEPPVLGFAFP